MRAAIKKIFCLGLASILFGSCVPEKQTLPPKKPNNLEKIFSGVVISKSIIPYGTPSEVIIVIRDSSKILKKFSFPTTYDPAERDLYNQILKIGDSIKLRIVYCPKFYTDSFYFCGYPDTIYVNDRSVFPLEKIIK